MGERGVLFSGTVLRIPPPPSPQGNPATIPPVLPVSNLRRVASVLLHNGGFCNGCITKRLLILQAFHSQENQYYTEQHKKYYNFYLFNFLSQRNCETRSFYDTFLELYKHRSVMPPLQNPPFYSSTVASYLQYTTPELLA